MRATCSAQKKENETKYVEVGESECWMLNNEIISEKNSHGVEIKSDFELWNKTVIFELMCTYRIEMALGYKKQLSQWDEICFNFVKNENDMEQEREREKSIKIKFMRHVALKLFFSTHFRHTKFRFYRWISSPLQLSTAQIFSRKINPLKDSGQRRRESAGRHHHEIKSSPIFSSSSLPPASIVKSRHSKRKSWENKLNSIRDHSVVVAHQSAEICVARIFHTLQLSRSVASHEIKSQTSSTRAHNVSNAAAEATLMKIKSRIISAWKLSGLCTNEIEALLTQFFQWNKKKFTLELSFHAFTMCAMCFVAQKN